MPQVFTACSMGMNWAPKRVSGLATTVTDRRTMCFTPASLQARTPLMPSWVRSAVPGTTTKAHLAPTREPARSLGLLMSAATTCTPGAAKEAFLGDLTSRTPALMVKVLAWADRALSVAEPTRPEEPTTTIASEWGLAVRNAFSHMAKASLVGAEKVTLVPALRDSEAPTSMLKQFLMSPESGALAKPDLRGMLKVPFFSALLSPTK
mmetsp:Transcript_24284/g.49188  ORF Transcript_24284/g.49188 Transcript_24284/m.49188 type:complete len:207 (-) Transcript_24284:159-779(-)